VRSKCRHLAAHVRNKADHSRAHSFLPWLHTHVESLACVIHSWERSQAQKPQSWERFTWVSSVTQQECRFNNPHQTTNVSKNIFAIFPHHSTYESYLIFMVVTNIVVKTNRQLIRFHSFTFTSLHWVKGSEIETDENFSSFIRKLQCSST